MVWTRGLLWLGLPAWPEPALRRAPGKVSLQVDGDIDDDPQPLEALAAHAGLTQPVHACLEAAAYGAHPLLGRLIAANRGLRVPQAASAFEALTLGHQRPADQSGGGHHPASAADPAGRAAALGRPVLLSGRGGGRGAR